jgi:hypothetical protein
LRVERERERKHGPRGGARARKDQAGELDGCIMHRVHTSTYESRKVSRVAMCEVRFKKKATKNKQKKKKYNDWQQKEKWTMINPI